MTRLDVAWLILRVSYGLLFLYTASTLIRGWAWTVAHTAILFGKQSKLFATGAIVLMIGGGLSMVLGLLTPLGAIMLIAFVGPGAVIHAREQKLALTMLDQIVDSVPPDKQPVLREIAWSAFGAHFANVLKNLVLISVAVFFLLAGPGPCSLDCYLTGETGPETPAKSDKP